MSLVPFWYIVIAVLWTGFFILEGFDFGVGMLPALVGRDEPGRRAVINTIGGVGGGPEGADTPPRGGAVVGGQGGVGDRRGRGHVRRVPRLVRHDVLRPLSRLGT